MTELWIIGVVGGGAGAALGGPLLVRTGGDSTAWPVERLTGLWLVGGAVSMLLVALRHGGIFPPAVDSGVEHLTNALSLVAWTVLVTLTRRVAGIEGAWPGAVADHLVLPALYLALMAVLGMPDIRFVWLMPVSIAGVVAIGMAWRHARAHASRAVRRQATAVFAFAMAFCAAQAVRSLFPRVPELREIVPMVITISFFAIGFALSRRTVASPAAPSYVKSGLTPARAQALATRLDRAMEQGGWYRDVDLSLVALAERLSVPPQWLSQVLNQQRGQTLTEYLTAWRMREARQLLLDPSNDGYTVDGLARQAGFASRSSFYKAFRRAEGVTPAEFRVRERAVTRRPLAG